MLRIARSRDGSGHTLVSVALLWWALVITPGLAWETDAGTEKIKMVVHFLSGKKKVIIIIVIIFRPTLGLFINPLPFFADSVSRTAGERKRNHVVVVPGVARSLYSVARCQDVRPERCKRKHCGERFKHLHLQDERPGKLFIASVKHRRPVGFCCRGVLSSY